jgi:hypothetical protein
LTGDGALDVTLEERSAVEVVDRDIEETLVLRVVQIHGDDVISAGAGQQVGHEGTGLSDPLLVAGSWLESGDLGRDVRRGLVASVGEGLEGVHCVVAGQTIAPLLDGTAGAVLDLSSGKTLLEVLHVVHQAEAFGFPGARSGRSALKCVAIGRFSSYGGLHKRSTGLVVWDITLARVGEERKDSGDSACRGGLAGGNRDQKLEQVIVHFSTAGLNDVDILLTDGLLYFNAGLTDGEFRE